MKKILLLIGSLFLMSISLSSFADKIVITGEPVVLQQQGDYYVVPDTYTVSDTYNYVTLNGTNQVCYAKPVDTLSSVKNQIVTVTVGGKNVSWTCYNYDDTYFSLTP